MGDDFNNSTGKREMEGVALYMISDSNSLQDGQRNFGIVGESQI